jgi:hypothetical protein
MQMPIMIVGGAIVCGLYFRHFGALMDNTQIIPRTLVSPIFLFFPLKCLLPTSDIKFMTTFFLLIILFLCAIIQKRKIQFPYH